MNDLQRYPCPVCKAGAGHPCVSDTKPHLMVVWVHTARVRRPPWWRQLWNWVRGVPTWNR